MEPIDSEEPLWDVALEALLSETHGKSGQPLCMADLEDLANEYTIRLDDLLDTLCLLVENRAWTYTDPRGRKGQPDQAVVRMLHANYRLNPTQLQRLRGHWQPAT